MSNMSIDRNKTALTHKLTAAAVAYLHLRGCKPIETEVGVAKGWIGDIATFVYPSYTEKNKLKLTHFWRDELRGQLLTVLVEVKTARADYLKDKKRKFTSGIFPAHLCYLAYPKGLICPDEIPEGWFGMEATKNGESIWRNHWEKGQIHSPQVIESLQIVAAVAIRRDHRTRYRAMRDWMRAHRAKENERKKRWRMNDLLTAIVLFFEGKEQRTIEEVLNYYGFKPRGFSKPLYERLTELRNIVAGKAN